MDLSELLKCPACGSPGLDTRRDGVVCTECDRDFPRRGGYVDLIDTVAHGEPTAATTEQRLMESQLVARIYDRFWRPAFVRMLAGGGANAFTGGFAGEFFIHKNALGMEDHDGAWLDLSCGPGTFTRAMASAAPGSWVVGADISCAMLETAAQRAAGYDNVALIRADAHDLPLRDESFSGVNNSGALHVYLEPERVFREILRVLKPGGLFVGSTFAPSRSLSRRVAAQLTGIRRFEPSKLRAWLSRVGFSDYDEVRLGGSFIFRTRKP